MKKTSVAFLAMALAFSGSVLAKEKELNIASNSSGLSEELSLNIGRMAVGMGVKEPLIISKSGENAKVSGSGSAVCTIKLLGEKIQGVSCQ